MNTFKKISKAIGAKYLIYPRIQIKYALIFTVLSCMGMFLCILGQSYFLGNSEGIYNDEGQLIMVSQNLWIYNLLILSVVSGTVFAASILVTHRFLGPTIAIKRTLDLYLQEKKIKKIVIRKTDEAHQLIGEINNFIQELNEK